MSSNQNAIDAAVSHHAATMGPALGSMFYTLWQHMTWAFTRWSNFRALFADRQSV